jgi:hypothetical protein
VRVRVGAAHSSTFVLEDLHEAVGIVRYRGVLVFHGQGEPLSNSCKGVRGGEVIRVDACPVLDNWEDIASWHIGEGDIMSRRERQDVANALDAACAKKLRLKVWR